ncbi:FHA domain-containing protein [Paludisphaera soli]|uniref:FHA domain-containing protein n=1 Tax=Paludisphaera soli TaxID=2712865 RepID=UPI001F0DC2BF|nr:FHA domain-containing protein [Paludisphaera soli]
MALDEGPDISLDRAMVVVGRHPACDARLDSLRVSRHHCCMTHDSGDVLVRDLGSTNGIRINGQRVEMGRLKAGDELSIAHIRYRLDDGLGHDRTLAESSSAEALDLAASPDGTSSVEPCPPFPAEENALAAAVRKMLPSSVAERCRIQVIVRMDDESDDSTPVGMSSSHAEKSSE